MRKEIKKLQVYSNSFNMPVTETQQESQIIKYKNSYICNDIWRMDHQLKNVGLHLKVCIQKIRNDVCN
jgi:hypothetical protein